MAKENTFEHVCACLAARNCWESGVSLTEIQRQIRAAGEKYSARRLIATAYGRSDISWINEYHYSHRPDKKEPVAQESSC